MQGIRIEKETNEEMLVQEKIILLTILKNRRGKTIDIHKLLKKMYGKIIHLVLYQKY